MANITEILGTDSVSSSRPVINNNFELLNDDIAAITALLDPTTATLSGLTGLSTQALTVAAGGSTLATVNANGATLEVDTTFNGALVVDGKLVKSGVVGSAAVQHTLLIMHSQFQQVTTVRSSLLLIELLVLLQLTLR